MAEKIQENLIDMHSFSVIIRIEKAKNRKLEREKSMKDNKGFTSEYQRLCWTAFKMSGGNPYIMSEVIRENKLIKERER